MALSMYSKTQANLFLLETSSLPLKYIDGTGLGDLVDVGSIFYTSVQGTYFLPAIFGTKYEIF